MDQITDHILDSIRKDLKLKQSSRFMILAPVVRDKRVSFNNFFQLKKQGFQRVRVDGTLYSLDEDFVLLKIISIRLARF